MKGNPVITDKFTADPAPLIHDGTLYLYVGHDEARDGEMFNITEMVVLFHERHEDVDRPWDSVEAYRFLVGRGRGLGFASSGERR